MNTLTNAWILSNCGGSELETSLYIGNKGPVLLNNITILNKHVCILYLPELCHNATDFCSQQRVEMWGQQTEHLFHVLAHKRSKVILPWWFAIRSLHSHTRKVTPHSLALDDSAEVIWVAITVLVFLPFWTNSNTKFPIHKKQMQLIYDTVIRFNVEYWWVLRAKAFGCGTAWG